MKKRVVSFILILVMLMTAMPWPSFADEPQTEPAAPAVETVVSGDEEPAEGSQPQPELPAVEEKKEFEIKESQPELSKAEEKDKVELPPVEKEEEKEEAAVKLTLVFTNAFGWAVKKEVEQGKAITYLPTAPEYEGLRFVRWYREVTKLADDGVTAHGRRDNVVFDQPVQTPGDLLVRGVMPVADKGTVCTLFHVLSSLSALLPRLPLL